MIRAALLAALLLAGPLSSAEAAQGDSSLVHRLVAALTDQLHGGLEQRFVRLALGDHSLRLGLPVPPAKDADEGADPDDAKDESDTDSVDVSDDADDAKTDKAPRVVTIQVGGKKLMEVISAPNLAPDGARPLFSEHAKHVAAAEVLQRIAQGAGWSLTLADVGAGSFIDVDFDGTDAIEATRKVLDSAHLMGVLRGDKLAVIPAGSGHSAGLLVEQREEMQAQRRGGKRSGDLVKGFGDLVIPSGTLVQGDAVAVLGSVEVEPGAVVRGSVVAGNGIVVHPGAVVAQDSASFFGDIEVERGGQVLGDRLQLGLGHAMMSRLRGAAHRSFLSRLGPFGLFPTLALFAITYLGGLLTLRLWPERIRAMGATLVESPVRSFIVGFLCWLLFIPLALLLVVSVAGILLVPLLPVAFLLSVMLGACGLALRVGEALPAAEGQRFVPPAALGMGLLAMMLVSFLPFLGTPLMVLVLFVAPGAVIGSRFGRLHPSL